MLQEGKSLQTKKHYLSNYNLRIPNPDIQTQPQSKQLNSQLSFRQQVVNTNFIIGDADTLFLTRQNERIQQELIELIGELQSHHYRSVAKLQHSSQLQTQLETQRSKTKRKATLLNRLLQESGQIVSLLRQKCRIIGFMAKIIQQLKCSQFNLKRKLQETSKNKILLETRCLALENQLQSIEALRLNRDNQEIQTQYLKSSHFQVQVQPQLITKHEHSTQTQRIRCEYRQTQTSIQVSQKATNTLAKAYQHQDCQTSKINTLQFQLQIGSPTTCLLQKGQQTEKLIFEQMGTATENAKLIQQQLKSLQIMVFLPPEQGLLIQNQKLKQNYCQIAIQTECQFVRERINQYKLNIQHTQAITIEPRQKNFLNQSTQTETQTDQKDVQVQFFNSSLFRFQSVQAIKIQPQRKQKFDQFTQILIQSVQQCMQTQKIQSESIQIMTKTLQFDQKAIQAQIQNQRIVTQKQRPVNNIGLQGQKNFEKPKRLSIIQELSLTIEQHYQVKFQTEVTQQEDTSLKMSFADKQVSQNVITYFKQISCMQNQISYNEQIVKDLEKNGQNEASKALSRLLKEHMYLKVCLNRMIDKQREQRQSNNQRIISLFEDSLQSYEKKAKDGQSAANECIIY